MKKNRQSYHVVLIKPSHYDDEGYVIQWRKTHMPTNSLGCVRGIMEEAADKKALGEDVDIVVEDYDEHCGVVPIKKIIHAIREASGGIVMMVGVQTSQFPRSLDLARSFREAGIQVMIGGFHVSGCVAMTPGWKPGLEAAHVLGVSLFAGELEGRAEIILKDAFQKNLKPLYNYLGKLPDLKTAPTPYLSRSALSRTALSIAGLDLGRGCPFLCSFCTIINVQGRTIRSRSVEKVVDYIRHSDSLGVSHYLISDDNFARNDKWEDFFDAFIELRKKEGIKIDLFIQVDTQAAKIPGFIEKAKAAGCSRVFIGMESVRQENLDGASKKQNKVEDLSEMAFAWKRAGILTYATVIVGFPDDTVEKVEEDIRFIQQNLAVDIVYFFILVPLPGSVDHKRFVEAGVHLETDLNKYDSEHITVKHPNMSDSELLNLYQRAWDIYYSPEHAATLFKRAVVTGVSLKEIFACFHGFYCLVKYENIHPLQSGLFRLKRRKARRPDLPLEPWWTFYPARVAEFIVTQGNTLLFAWKLWRIMKKAVREVEKNGYTDKAIEGFKKRNL